METSFAAPSSLPRRKRRTVGRRGSSKHPYDPSRRRAVPGGVPYPLHHLSGPVPVDCSRLDQTHEATPTDPLARTDLSDQIVAGA